MTRSTKPAGIRISVFGIVCMDSARNYLLQGPRKLFCTGGKDWEKGKYIHTVSLEVN
jgi:hypothetical protein